MNDMQRSTDDRSEEASSQLILGAAVGYDVEQLAPFLESLRRSGYRGDIALIVDASMRERLSASPVLDGVELLGVPYWARCRTPVFHPRNLRSLPWLPLQLSGWLGMQAAPRAQAERWACKFFHPQISRYFVFRDYLVAHPYQRVLLSDVRDVLFQSNPFETLPQRGLAVSMESTQYAIAEEPWNSSWIRTGYGNDMLRTVGDNPVSCAGVTYGDGNAMRRYLDLMIDELLSLPWRATLRAGMDQGVHNVLLWTGRLKEVVQLSTLESPVATLNEIGTQNLHFDAQDRLLNGDGSLVSIVHQYDRPDDLAPRLFAALGLA